MKQLFLCVFLLVVVGLVGFLYRGSVQAPTHGTNSATSTSSGCTEEAKVCPDGQSVARSGPSCTFSACPLPNIELPSFGIGFVQPAGFKEAKDAYGNDATLIGAFERLAASSSPQDAIVVRRYPIPAGKDANAVMLSETMYESSGLKPASMNEFTPVIINNRTYQMIGVERFEALVRVLYYLPRENDVLRFEAVERDVANWTDPSLSVRSLPTVRALEQMLATLQLQDS